MTPPTVILVAYHGDAWMPECVATLRRSLTTPTRLIVVDNAGNTCIDRLDLGGLESQVIRCERPLGFAEANNFALQKMDFDTQAVCFLNQDTRSGPGWLDACIACLHDRPDVGAVMPMIATYDGEGWDQPFLECARKSESFSRDFAAGGDLEPFYETPVITAAAMVVRTQALVAAGPFDPIYGSYYEDYDLCRRIREAGYRVGVCTRGRIQHYSGSATTSAAARRRRARQLIRNRFIYRIREAGDERFHAALCYLLGPFVYNLGRSILRTSSSQPLGAYLGAHGDLLSCIGRLMSKTHDQRDWHRYLTAMGWPATTGASLESSLP